MVMDDRRRWRAFRRARQRTTRPTSHRRMRRRARQARELAFRVRTAPRTFQIGLLFLSSCFSPLAGESGHTIDAEPTARANACMRSGSLMPGDRSTPDDTSTIAGPIAAMAAATLTGFSPPARTIGVFRADASAAGAADVL